MDAFREPHRWMAILQSVVEAAWLLRGCCMVESWPTIWLSAGIAVVATESGSWPRLPAADILRTIDWQVRARLRDRIIKRRELPRSEVNFG